MNFQLQSDSRNIGEKSYFGMLSRAYLFAICSLYSVYRMLQSWNTEFISEVRNICINGNVTSRLRG